MKIQRVFTIRKFIKADNLKDVLKKEKKHYPDEVYMDEFNVKSYCEDLMKKKV